MSNSTHFHSQLLDCLRQYSHYCDLRHLNALAWMVSALICSGQLSLPAWEPFVLSRAQKAQSMERRWRRFLGCGADSSESAVCAIGVSCLKRLATPSTVSGLRHYRAVESLLHETQVGRLLWASYPAPVASVRT